MIVAGLVLLLFWVAYIEFVNLILSSLIGYSLLWSQPFVLIMALLVIAITAGSQTKGE